MKCNMCGMQAKFRARSIGCTFLWWCQVCYDAHDHKDLPHDKDFPILCHKCNDQPASFRVQSQLKPWWSYWCYTCFEQDEHDGESLDDPFVWHVLDSASDSNEDEKVDDGADDAVDDGTQSSSSFNSWHLPLASNLQSLALQSNDDTMSIASSQSFMMAYQLLDNDDTASMSSFQMLANTDEQQDQEQQQDQEPDAEQDEQEPNMDAVTTKGNVADDDPDAQQQDAQGIGKDAEHNLGGWQEDQEMLIAVEKSIEDVAPVADSSSSSSSSSMPTLAASIKLPAPRPKGKKMQRWPLSDYVPSANSQARKCKDGKVSLTGLVSIPEVQFDGEMHISEYVDSSGCTQTVFTDGSIKSSSQVPMCTMHHVYHPHCQACANHQFFKEKHNHDVELAKAIEASLDTSCVIYMDSMPYCSKHADNMVEFCQTCKQVCDLRDQLFQA